MGTSVSPWPTAQMEGEAERVMKLIDARDYVAGPGRSCSSRHGMPFHSRNEGFK